MFDEFRDATTHVIINDHKVLRKSVWKQCACGASSKDHTLKQFERVSSCERTRCKNFTEAATLKNAA